MKKKKNKIITTGKPKQQQQKQTFKFNTKNRDDTGKSSFLSIGYFVEIDNDVYQCYKEVMLEDNKTKKQYKADKTVAWGKPLRKAMKGDPIIAVTGPAENLIELTAIDESMRVSAAISGNYMIKE